MASKLKIKRRQWSWGGKKASKRFYKDQQTFNKERYKIVRFFNHK
jgi:hypothetical protein